MDKVYIVMGEFVDIGEAPPPEIVMVTDDRAYAEETARIYGEDTLAWSYWVIEATVRHAARPAA